MPAASRPTPLKAVPNTGDSDLNPPTQHYEFLGPPGALLISTLTPFLAFAFTFTCSEKAGGCPRSWSELPALLADNLSDVQWWKAQWDPVGFTAYWGWYAFTVIAWAVLPGDWVEGLPLRTGQKLKYKINGAFSPTNSHFLLFSSDVQPRRSEPFWNQ